MRSASGDSAGPSAAAIRCSGPEAWTADGNAAPLKPAVGRSSASIDERRDAPRPAARRFRGVAEDELVAGAGHRHVEQAPLLLEVAVALGQDLVDELDRQRERLAARPRREPVGGEARQEDDRELEALGLVHRHDVDRVDVRIRVRGRGVVAGLDQRREVAGEEDRPVVGEQRRLRPDDVEEPADVRELLLGGDARRRRRAPRASRVSRRNA